mmetsp:Transcript_124310/g.387010  ORF Transcript_124310/g.387010 Transcript_124310/m.387010 type:complete len:242 (-) Transcript_124310:578-1303(-)
MLLLPRAAREVPHEVPRLPLVGGPVPRGGWHEGVEVCLVHEGDLGRHVEVLLGAVQQARPQHLPEEHGLVPSNAQLARGDALQEGQGPLAAPKEQRAGVDTAGVLGDQEVRPAGLPGAVGLQHVRDSDVGVREEGVAIDEKDPVRAVHGAQGLVNHQHFAVVGLPVRQRQLRVQDVSVPVSCRVGPVVGHGELRQGALRARVRGGVATVGADAVDLYPWAAGAGAGREAREGAQGHLHGSV